MQRSKFQRWSKCHEQKSRREETTKKEPAKTLKEKKADKKVKKEAMKRQ
ncbi:hypothetical protein ACFQAT_11650 [Undibacterium arcticum]